MTTTGNLLDMFDHEKFDIICHGCNCFFCFGGGIARQIAIRYPEAAYADKKTGYGDIHKLGTFSSAHIAGKGKILNCYTQYHYSSNKVAADYEAIRRVMHNVKQQYTGLRIGMPRIGCGLAGGDENIIIPIICEELSGEDFTIVILK